MLAISAHRSVAGPAIATHRWSLAIPLEDTFARKRSKVRYPTIRLLGTAKYICT